MTSPAELERYDSALLGILSKVGELDPFLDVFFRFLASKTDFFHVSTEDQQKYGFPEGEAFKIIKNKFMKYKQLTRKMLEEAKKAEERKQAEIEKQALMEKSAEEKSEETKLDASSSKEPDAVPEPKEIPTTQLEFQKNPESYNGAVRENYSWSQNYDDIDIIVPVDKSVTKGCQVKVNIERSKLFVSYTSADGTENTVIDSRLTHEVMKQDSMWSLEGGKSINITLSKDVKYWWKALLVEEEEIDLKDITPERPMTDMAEDELAVINKLQFDEKQKRLGLPQSHEIKVHEMLKKGWDAEGSPFKGQEFDPKMFHVSPSAVE